MHRNIELKDYLAHVNMEARKVGFKYDLVANIVHDGLPGAGKGTYRCHVLHKVYTPCGRLTIRAPSTGTSCRTST